MRGAGLPFIDAGHHQYDTFCDLRLARLLGEIGESSEKHAGKAAPRRTDQGHAGHPRGINVLSSKSAEAGQQTSRGAKCGTSNRTPPESAHLIVVISSNADRFIIVVVRSDHADLPAANPGSLKPGHGTCCLGMGIEQSADCLHLRPGPTPVRSVGPLLPGLNSSARTHLRRAKAHHNVSQPATFLSRGFGPILEYLAWDLSLTCLSATGSEATPRGSRCRIEEVEERLRPIADPKSSKWRLRSRSRRPAR